MHLKVPVPIYDGAYDAILRAHVFPLVSEARARRLVTRAFFVRYREDGPHVRLRLLPTSEEAFATLQELIRASPTVRAGGLEWLSVPYVPELDRYGGPDAMAIAEMVFDHSTTFAMVELREELGTDRALRLGHAVLATLAGAFAMLGDRTAVTEFIQSYGRDYLTTASRFDGPDSERRLHDAFRDSSERQAASMAPYVREAWRCLEEGESLTAPLDAYVIALRSARAQYRALQAAGLIRTPSKVFRSWPELMRYILPSLTHMTNNRLGVTVIEEAFVAVALHRALIEP